MPSHAQRLYSAANALAVKVRHLVRGVGWRRLIFVQRLVFQRAIVALPLIGTAVAASPKWVSNYFLNTPSLHFVYWGSLIFLAGQIIVWLRQPVEFKRQLDIREEIAHIKDMITTLDHCQNRADMLREICSSASQEEWPGLQKHVLYIASQRCSNTLTDKNWQHELPGLETSIRDMMDYSHPEIRQQAVWISAVGIIVMMSPTIVYGILTACLMLFRYARFVLSIFF